MQLQLQQESGLPGSRHPFLPTHPRIQPAVSSGIGARSSASISTLMRARAFPRLYRTLHQGAEPLAGVPLLLACPLVRRAGHGLTAAAVLIPKPPSSRVRLRNRPRMGLGRGRPCGAGLSAQARQAPLSSVGGLGKPVDLSQSVRTGRTGCPRQGLPEAAGAA